MLISNVWKLVMQLGSAATSEISLGHINYVSGSASTISIATLVAAQQLGRLLSQRQQRHKQHRGDVTHCATVLPPVAK